MSKRIIIVDDSRVVHAQMKKILQGTEFEVVKCCQDGESALKAYETYKPDLVTMDIIMPGMDGLKAAKEILQRWPDAKILMITSLAYDDTIEEAEQIGAVGFIYKPFAKESLAADLRKALGEQ